MGQTYATIYHLSALQVKAGDDLQLATKGQSNRLDSGGTSYPTADGTSGQSIITDGSGNLTFGTAAGTGITAVVQDTTPQLGGDLESNGHDILFADNDKAIFGAGHKTYRFIMMGLMVTSKIQAQVTCLWLAGTQVPNKQTTL